VRWESFSLRSRSVLPCRTLDQSRPRLAGLVPLMGKASVSNIRVSFRLVDVPKALAMARLSVVASPLAILPLPPFRFCPLAAYCPIRWHLTANPPHRLAPYCSSQAGTLLLLTGWHPTAHLTGWHPLCSVAPLAFLPLRSFGPSSVTPSRGIALPPRLCPTLGNDVITCPTVHHAFWRALNLLVFRRRGSPILSPRPREGLRAAVVSFLLGSLLKGLGFSTCRFLCIVSLRV